MKKSFKQLLTIQIFMLLVIITGFFSGTVFKSDLKVLFLFISFIALYSVFKLDIKNDYKYKKILKTVIWNAPLRVDINKKTVQKEMC